MKPSVLFIASEVAPFAKVGGLADVASALPKALRAAGVDCRVILPLYRRIRQQYGDRLRFHRWSMLKMGWRTMYTGLLSLVEDGVQYYFIDNEYYFGQDGIYLDYGFDIERYCFFQRAVLEALGAPMDFFPQILHCNDWQTGLIPALLQAHYWPAGFFRDVKTVFTIHNLRHQGIHSAERIADLCDLSPAFLHDFGVLKDGLANMLKAGLVYADQITTVSPSYAEEILMPYYGEGLDGVLAAYREKLSGILNGLDTAVWDPERDEALPQKYNLDRVAEGKKACRSALLAELGMPEDPARPLAVLVSRLVDQKGLDLLLRVLDELLDTGMQLIVLGTGEAYYEHELRACQERRPQDCRALLCFDNHMAHKLYAAADLFLMPSIFEPCGLSQMISQRYGTLPVVRETGGLRDTVLPYNEYTGEGDGFSFANINAHEFLFTCQYAVRVYRERPEAWAKLREQAMRKDLSWTRSAQAYISCYERCLTPNGADEQSSSHELDSAKVESSSETLEAKPKRSSRSKTASEKKSSSSKKQAGTAGSAKAKTTPKRKASTSKTTLAESPKAGLKAATNDEEKSDSPVGKKRRQPTKKSKAEPTQA